MRYECYICGAGGASGDRNTGPASYHCHECKGRGTMVPVEHLAVYKLVRECDQYLSTNERTSIGSGSTLHRKMKDPTL
ncbi:hypothetical protein D3C85_963690 [compost metagenome]